MSPRGALRRGRWRRRATTAALLALVCLTPAACGGSPSTPQATVRAFLAAWRNRDWSAMARLLDDPPADFAAINRAALAGLGVTEPRFTAGRVTRSGSVASAPVTEHLPLSGAGTWGPTTTVRLVNAGGRWRVKWSPSTINPALRSGDRLLASNVWAPRAAITGTGGAALTTQRPQVIVGLVGRRIKDRATVTADLLRAGASTAEVSQALAQARAHPDYFDPVLTVSKPRYEQLKAQPGPANVYSVPGTQFELTSMRSALTPQLAAHVVGSVGPITAQQLQQLGAPYDAVSVVGQTGLEAQDERRLAGRPGKRVTVLDSRGATVATLAGFPDHPGRALRTSIDPVVQRAAESAMSGEAHPAALVAIRASTGQLLAVVSDPISDGYDQALEGEYPPGSTFKVITASALISAGLGPDSPADCAPSLTIDGEVFHNAEGDGPVQTLAQGFIESCNTTFISLALAHLDPAAFTAAAQRYGLERTPRPGLAAFAAVVPPASNRTALAATAIGQAGVLFSPLGMAMVAAAVDDGSARAPRLVDGSPDDSVTPAPLPVAVTADLRPMMAKVVADGTAAGTGLPPGTHAKTGTAQYGSAGTLRTDAWLMGYDRDLAFAIVVQNTGGANGGPTDGPIIARFLGSLGGARG